MLELAKLALFQLYVDVSSQLSHSVGEPPDMRVYDECHYFLEFSEGSILTTPVRVNALNPSSQL